LKKNILFLLIIITLTGLGLNLYKKNVLHREADFGDAPISYGYAPHYSPDTGPYFGNKRGDNDTKVATNNFIFATSDNGQGVNDEDAFLYKGNSPSIDSNSHAFFVPEIRAEESVYTLDIPIKDAETGDPVRGWIDFNGNGVFEEEEKAGTLYKGGAFAVLTWRLPLGLNTMLTYLRIRTCKSIYAQEIEFANGAATSGEVEDYALRIIKLIVPSSELKEYIDFSSFDGTTGINQTAQVISNLKIDHHKIAFNLFGKPELVGINNMHDAGVTGLRLGHEDTTVRDKKNPIIATFKSDTLLENVNFQLIDIDGGDRIKIEGFKNGTPVSFSISNLTDNYFHQFNATLSEIYSDLNTDAGNDSLIPSSLDMAVNISFNDFVDSIKITYTDDNVSSSGTFTIGNFSIRKYNLPDAIMQNFIAAENENTVNLSWKLLNPVYISTYYIQRSYDGMLFETIETKSIRNNYDTVFNYADVKLPPVIQLCYYRIKIAQIDNHYSYSSLLRVRKKGSLSLSGFKVSTPVFTNHLNLLLLKDMPGIIKVILYDYEGKKTASWEFKDKNKNEVLLISDLEKLADNIYYIEIINEGKKYLIEVSKNI
jgi:hypothetical protein